MITEDNDCLTDCGQTKRREPYTGYKKGENRSKIRKDK